jgi:hypothetical protein
MKDASKQVWQAPTRRAFVAMLGLGAAALAVVKVHRKRAEAEPERSTWTGTTRWIGHC